jgi:hypothetical protein
MINPFKQVDWNPDEGGKKKFALSLCLGFPIIGLIFYVLETASIGLFSAKACFYLGIGGGGLGAILWIIPMASKPVYYIWYAAACCIGFIISNTLFVLFYFMIITPIGLIMRITGRDLLNLRSNPAKKTYWQDHERTQDPKRYYRQY